MYDLTIKTKDLPDNPIELSNIIKIGDDIVKTYKHKINAMSEIIGNEEEIKETLKKAQMAGIKLLYVYEKIGEIALRTKQSNHKNKIIRDEKGQIIKTIPIEDINFKPKWKKLGLPSDGHLKVANQIYNNPDIVKKTIDQALKNEDIPTRSQFRTFLRNKHTINKPAKEKKLIIRNCIKKLELDIMNNKDILDDKFLEESKKRLKKMIDFISDLQSTSDWKKNGPTNTEKKHIARLI